MDSNDNNIEQPTQASESHPEFGIRSADLRDRIGRPTEFSRDNTWRRRWSRQRRPMALSVRCGPLG